MSFLAPDRLPFSIVQNNPTIDSLEAAIQVEFQTGNAIDVTNGGTFVDPSTGLIVSGAGSTTDVTTTPGGPVARVLVTGGGARVNMTGATDIEGTNLGNSPGAGTVFETADASNDFGTKTIALSSQYNTDNLVVDGNQSVGGNESSATQQSLSEAAGGQAGDINFYAHGGAGDDLLVGSGINDFLRGGAGDDSISASAGNDLVRGGAGSDEIFLGAGQDSVYYTADQLDGGTDVLADFESGTDKITFDSDLQFSTDSLTPTNELEVNVNGDKVTIISQGDAIQAEDIDFV